MSFNSITYILFLWTIYVVWWSLSTRRPLRHAFILLASWWFYAQAHPAYVLILVGSSITDYIAGARIHRAREAGDGKTSRAWLIFSLVTNLGVLGVFKYFDFFSAGVQESLAAMGLEVATWKLDLVLPVGISFYTFQTLSYSLDISRGRLKPVGSFIDFAVYVAFFPQLVAGPIVRAKDFLPQLAKPARLTSSLVGSGLFQILQGLCKKLLIADVIGSQLVDPILANEAALASLDALDVVLLGVGFAVQLYGDFAGYSDVAIGSSRLLGIELRRNFDSPYRSTSLEEFWARWHISMSTWFRDYLFAPLVGRRSPVWRIQAATLATFLIVGLWHGAAWTFIVFGGLHGLALCLLRWLRMATRRTRLDAQPAWGAVSWLTTFLFVALTSLLYRAPTIADWGLMMSALGNWSIDGLTLPWQVWLVLGIGLATHLMPQRLADGVERLWERAPAPVQGVCVAASIPLLFGLAPPGVRPFIYFQF